MTSCLLTASKVNVSLQGKVQRVTPTYPMQVSTVEHYLRVKIKWFYSIFIHVGDCWK